MFYSLFWHFSSCYKLISQKAWCFVEKKKFIPIVLESESHRIQQLCAVTIWLRMKGWDAHTWGSIREKQTNKQLSQWLNVFYYKNLSSLTQHDGRVHKMQSPLKNLTFNTIILEIKFQYESLYSEGAIQSHLYRGYTNLQEDMENTMYEKEGLIQQCVHLH